MANNRKLLFAFNEKRAANGEKAATLTAVFVLLIPST